MPETQRFKTFTIIEIGSLTAKRRRASGNKRILTKKSLKKYTGKCYTSARLLVGQFNSTENVSPNSGGHYQII